MASPAPDAELPQPIQKLIDQVVRRTRLWPGEKRDVRAELASHFREGLVELARNESAPPDRAAEALCERFGDPRVAARLIRRAKKRRRPVAWKLFVVAWHGFEVALVLLALYVGWVFTGRPNPSIDYVAKLNAPIDQVSESERAWPIFRQVALDLKHMSKELSNSCDVEKVKPGDDEWPAAIAWLESNRHLLPDIRKAAQRQICGYRYDRREALRFMWEDSQRHPSPGQVTASVPFTDSPEAALAPQLISMLLPPLSSYRQIAKLLIFEARVRLEGGDFAGAWDSLDTAHRLGSQLVVLNTLIEQLAGAAILRIACDSARAILYEHQAALTSDQIHAVRTSHLINSSADVVQTSVRMERDNFEDMVQYLFTDGGFGGGHLIPSQLARMHWSGTQDEKVAAGFAAIHAGRKATLAKYHGLWDQLDALRRLPLNDSQRGNAETIIEKLKNDPIDKLRYGLVLSMIPSLNRADELMRVAAMNQAATQTVAALMAYRADRRKWPNRLQELVPDYLTRTPIDVYCGDELHYRVSADGSFVLYSIGENLADDGGRRELIEGNGPFKHIPADIVYWPPSDSAASTHAATSVPAR